MGIGFGAVKIRLIIFQQIQKCSTDSKLFSEKAIYYILLH